MTLEKILEKVKIPPCAGLGIYATIRAVPSEEVWGDSQSASEQSVYLAIQWDAAITVYSGCGDCHPTGWPLTSNGVTAEMKGKNKTTARRVVLTLDAEQYKNYITLLGIVRKTRGAVSMSEMVAPLMPDAEYVASCVMADWCETESERAAMATDLRRAGLLAW